MPRRPRALVSVLAAAGSLALALALAPAPASAQESCEPTLLSARDELTRALEASETIARVATDGHTVYAALCRGAGYAFLLAEPASPSSGELARRGLELAARGRALAPGRVEAHYRYATCLGLYLREHPLAGITRVSELLSAARRAADLDGSYDRGGPHRLLARIYAEAPRLIGPGDHDLARAHLARLLEVAGQDPENRLTAVCVHLAMGDEDEARRRLTAIDPGGLSEPLARERARLARALDD